MGFSCVSLLSFRGVRSASPEPIPTDLSNDSQTGCAIGAGRVYGFRALRFAEPRNDRLADPDLQHPTRRARKSACSCQAAPPSAERSPVQRKAFGVISVKLQRIAA